MKLPKAMLVKAPGPMKVPNMGVANWAKKSGPMVKWAHTLDKAIKSAKK